MFTMNLQLFAHKKGVGSSRNVGIGKDDTLFAKIDGVVRFETRHLGKKTVSVYAAEE